MWYKIEVIKISKYCSDCGIKIRETANFCEGCGVKILSKKQIYEKIKKELREEIKNETELEIREKIQKEMDKNNILKSKIEDEKQIITDDDSQISLLENLPLIFSIIGIISIILTPINLVIDYLMVHTISNFTLFHISNIFGESIVGIILLTSARLKFSQEYNYRFLAIVGCISGFLISIASVLIIFSISGSILSILFVITLILIWISE